MSQATNNEANIHTLIRQAERCRLQHDYLNALEYFEEITKEVEQKITEEDNETDYIGTWAWAHRGETYMAYAQTLDDFDKRAEHYKYAVNCFNKVLGVTVKDDLTDEPTLKNEDGPLKEKSLPNHYAWALAHRGEALRVIGNEWHLPFEGKDWTRENTYQEAIDCFHAALGLDKNYAWAYAHLGATLCNRRLWYLDNLSDRIKVGGVPISNSFKEALRFFDIAINLADHNYAWCFAYKTVAYVQLGRYDLALFSLMAAVLQDHNIVESLIEPPGQFDLPLVPGERYADAMWLYMSASRKEPRDAKQQAYVLYYHAVVVTIGQKPNQKDTSDSSTFTPEPPITRIENELDRLEEELPNDPDILYMKGGVAALKKSEDDDALNLLGNALKYCTDKTLSRYKAQARIDPAWYELRKDQRFKDLTDERRR